MLLIHQHFPLAFFLLPQVFVDTSTLPILVELELDFVDTSTLPILMEHEVDLSDTLTFFPQNFVMLLLIFVEIKRQYMCFNIYHHEKVKLHHF